MYSSSGGQNWLWWYHHTYRCDDTRGCVMQFWPPYDEHMYSKHLEVWNKTYCKTNFAHQVVNYWDKYTDMYGQQNGRNVIYLFLRCKLPGHQCGNVVYSSPRFVPGLKHQNGETRELSELRGNVSCRVSFRSFVGMWAVGWAFGASWECEL